TGAFGLAFLISLATPRPLAFLLARQLEAGDDRERLAAFDARWARPGFRRTMRRLTALWALVLLAEAAVRTLLAFRLPVATFLAVWPLVQIAFAGGAILMTVAMVKSARARAARAAAERAAP